MVPYDESTASIQEFWKLSSAKNGHQVAPSPGMKSSEESCQTGETQSFQEKEKVKKNHCGVEEGIHLMVVWFDLLRKDGHSLITRECSGAHACDQY